MSDKLQQGLVAVQATAGTATVGTRMIAWIEQNATLITLGFTALTFLVFFVSTALKTYWEWKRNK